MQAGTILRKIRMVRSLTTVVAWMPADTAAQCGTVITSLETAQKAGADYISLGQRKTQWPSQVWYAPVVPALRRDDHESMVTLSYTDSHTWY